MLGTGAVLPHRSVWMQAGDPLESPAEEVSGSARRMAESFLEAMPRVGVALVIILIGYGLSRLLRWVLHLWLQRKRTASFARVMSKLAGWMLFGVAALSATAAAFPSVKPVDLLAGLGFFSVAVGFAFQDILENTLSGVLLLFRQPFEAGDQIEVQDEAGTVEAITIRETRIKTFDGQLVLIPNRDVYKNVIRVQTHYPVRRLTFVVGIAYEADARRACAVTVDALGRVEGVASEPRPEALVAELGVSTINIEARLWCEPRQHETRQVLDEAIKTVKEALDDAGIELPADIVALQATPSFRAAIHGDAELTPGGSVAAPVATGAPGP
jgi:small conductance mechanosensitive channel